MTVATRRHAARGFTLLELMATMLVVSIIIVVVMPVITTAVSRYGEAAAVRRTTERVSYATDRVVRLLREIPIDANGRADIDSLTGTGVTLNDASGVRLSSGALLLAEPGGDENTLCDDITTFEIQGYAADGVTTTNDLSEIWSIRVRIVSDEVELRTLAFLRGRIGEV